MSTPQKKLLFEHVPKCGGTSIINYLASQYSRDRIFAIDGNNPEANIARFRKLPREVFNYIDLIAGHNAHHLVDILPANWLKFTLLRDPIDRIVSHYYYVLESPGHYLHQAVKQPGMTLEDYATSGLSHELQNYYTCLFLGISDDAVKQDPAGAANRAFSLLSDDYDVVGVLEHLQAALDTLAEKAGFVQPYIPRRLNQTKHRIKLTDVQDSTRRAIAEVNSADVLLYDRVMLVTPQNTSAVF